MNAANDSLFKNIKGCVLCEGKQPGEPGKYSYLWKYIAPRVLDGSEWIEFGLIVGVQVFLCNVFAISKQTYETLQGTLHANQFQREVF